MKIGVIEVMSRYDVPSQIHRNPKGSLSRVRWVSELISTALRPSSRMAKVTKKSPKPETPNPATAEEARPTKKVGSHGDKRILSIAIDPNLHAKLALLARCEGRSVTQLVVESVSKNLKSRIEAALETLRADLDK
jgi:hypothetical protein